MCAQNMYKNKIISVHLQLNCITTYKQDSDFKGMYKGQCTTHLCTLNGCFLCHLQAQSFMLRAVYVPRKTEN